MSKATATKTATRNDQHRSTSGTKSSKNVVWRNAITGAFISTTAAKKFSVTTDRNGVTVVKLK